MENICGSFFFIVQCGGVKHFTQIPTNGRNNVIMFSYLGVFYGSNFDDDDDEDYGNYFEYIDVNNDTNDE